MSKGGRPSFKNYVKGVDWQSRRIDVSAHHLDLLSIAKRKGICEGLDHAIYLALEEFFDKKEKLDDSMQIARIRMPLSISLFSDVTEAITISHPDAVVDESSDKNWFIISKKQECEGKENE